MRIFLSYGSEDREVAREVAATLRASGHRVFFDRTELCPGSEFHAEISRQLQISDVIIFLLSPSMLETGRYPLSEIELAERRWPNPANRVFPVVVRPIDQNSVPGYLRAVTIMTPPGPIAASIVQTMQRFQRRRLKYRLIIAAIVTISLASLAMLGTGLFWAKNTDLPSKFESMPKDLKRFEQAFIEQTDINKKLFLLLESSQRVKEIAVDVEDKQKVVTEELSKLMESAQVNSTKEGIRTSQERISNLTARKDELELKAQFINQQRLVLANQTTNIWAQTSTLPEGPARDIYLARIKSLQEIDKALELELRRIDTQCDAAATELEAVKRVIQHNIEKAFGTMG